MAVLIGSLGSVGMWSVVVALPVVQTEFAASRGTASLAFTLVMLGFGSGGVLTGKITDRYGIVTAIGLGIGILGLGYIGAGMASSTVVVLAALVPMAAYFAFLLGYLVIDCVRSVLCVPGKLDALRK